jgi:hypothetical protein
VVIAALSIEAIITAPTIEAVMKVTAGEGLISICSDALDRDRPAKYHIAGARSVAVRIGLSRSDDQVIEAVAVHIPR